jgi:hypothetical protein
MAEATPETVDDIFDPENIPESAWFKFDKIGVKCSGKVLSISEKEERDGMPAQRVFDLEQKDGSVIKVGLKKTSDYLMGKTNLVKVGDLLGVHYVKDIPPKVKGHHAAKSIEVYWKKAVITPATDDNFGFGATN